MMKFYLALIVCHTIVFLPGILAPADLDWYMPRYPVTIMQVMDWVYILDSPNGNVIKEVRS